MVNQNRNLTFYKCEVTWQFFIWYQASILKYTNTIFSKQEFILNQFVTLWSQNKAILQMEFNHMATGAQYS